MASQDEIQETLIDVLGQRLREFICVEQVLEQIHFLKPEQKELIRQTVMQKGNHQAVGVLLTAVVKRPHAPGWFQAFVDALNHGGSGHAADLLEKKMPEPEDEAENDYCIRLIHLLAPGLTDMRTDTVAEECNSQKLLTDQDYERVKAETENKGGKSGASELLRRIVRCRPGWFSTFVEILRKTEHKYLYELTGGLSNQDQKQLLVEDKPTGSETRSPESPDTAESSKVVIASVTDKGGNDVTDLYTGDEQLTENGIESLQPDGSDPGESATGPERADIVLRDYQMAVASPALEGKNIIICLPTGSGKTRVAVYITKAHLDSRRVEGKPGKVVVLVNKVPLVEQHFNTEFEPYLSANYKLGKVSGDSPLKISFTEVVKKNDIIICTAQILENYLERSGNGDDEGVNLSDLTLMVIDECHHTQKGGVYNHIMMRCLKLKHKNRKLKKEQKEPLPLPQILGLTASPGVGKATKMDKAEEHIMRICANLDACKIMTADLGEYNKDQRKQITLVEHRKEDPFGDLIKYIMRAIHRNVDLNPTCELGSQNYEQWVVQTGRFAEKEENQKVRVSADHLQQYCEGLNLCNTIRMCDAYNFLTKFYMDKIKEKTDEEHQIQITETEKFLFNLFQEHKDKLETLSKNPKYENDSLTKLRGTVLYEFSMRDKARGIVFTKTRRSAIALTQWIRENSKFADIGVKSAYVIGAGDQSVVKPMTPAEQKDVLKKFGNGDVNLLIATAVAEEGLDIPECNFVIRYGHVTNEIAMIQAQGRGRAEGSSYTLVDVKNSGVAEKEDVNEFRKDLMTKAIKKIQKLDQEGYEKQITEFQIQTIMEVRIRTKKKKKESIRNTSPSDVKFSCRGCNKHACTGDDIKIIEDMHRVNVTKEFEKLFIRRENTSLQERLLDYETNGYISCAECGQRWGSMMVFRAMEIPCLHVKNFVVNIDGQNISKCTKWRELPVQFSAFDYTEHANQLTSSDDDETM